MKSAKGELWYQRRNGEEGQLEDSHYEVDRNGNLHLFNTDGDLCLSLAAGQWTEVSSVG